MKQQKEEICTFTKGEMTMSKIDDYISNRSKRDQQFKSAADQYDTNLDVAVAVRNLRESEHMTQREFALLIGKPQSTVARIESGSMNASTKLLTQIAQATHKKLIIQFS